MGGGAEVAEELDLVALGLLDGLVGGAVAGGFEAEAGEGAEEVGLPAREVADEERLSVEVARQEADGGEEAGEGDVVEGRVADDDAELLAQPFRAVDVEAPEAREGREAVVYVEDADGEAALGKLAAQEGAAEAAGVVVGGEEVGQVGEGGAVEEVLFVFVKLVHSDGNVSGRGYICKNNSDN